MGNDIFSVKSLEFTYEKQKAKQKNKRKIIRNLDFSLKEGIITTLIGANGCGKSTLFNLMTKNLKPDSGKILMNGENIGTMKLKEFAKRVSIVHQYSNVPADLSVKKFVSYGRTPYHSFGISKNPDEDEEKINWALEITNTMKHKDKAVAELSGGQVQRVRIAMALAQDTKVLFLDEPTTYLDISYQLQLLKLIRFLNTEFKMTIIMVLHDINQSLHYSDEIIAMKDGTMIAQGVPEEIITPQLIEEIYNVRLDIKNVAGKPFIIPV